MRRIIVLSIFLILGFFGCIGKKETIATPTNRVLIKTTEGDITLLLYDETPLHQANFLKLAEEGFYDSLLFHRVIKGFMVQGGDPKSKGASAKARLGSGGPGYTVPAEFNAKFIHKKGAISAARTGGPGNPKKASSGSQFYLVQGKSVTDSELDNIELRIQRSNPEFKYTPEQREIYKTIGGTPFLDMDYTVYGEVIEGLDVIDKIAAVPTAPGDRPLTDVMMSIEVIKEYDVRRVRKD